MKKFKPGDRVSHLDHPMSGVVREVSGSNLITVLNDDGFEEKVFAHELVPEIVSLPLPELANERLMEQWMKQKEAADMRPASKGHKRRGGIEEHIDLHIEQLIDSHRGMSNAEIVTFQMRAFERFFQNALRKNLYRVLIIHGKGEGVLRSEIHQYLRNFANVEFFDSDLGRGSTEVIIK